ncbi:hypothetical protein CRM22_003323 [Opisthorchis felineus]|uniref:Glutathione S-transferase C-terminal domain-containing protein n=1 Tax=Opisthorchis felineus TaxID=147828 RepID=A0A4V3SFX9_OPIFE|nr:hypothetical protein CRM22_003323 [Opisthorchis felineus]TGZ70194.1 hypothetical protein CRM22_003323 [Opisthorchis felineus]
MPTLSKHLRQGDPKPDINPNHYTLFGNRFCPFVERLGGSTHPVVFRGHTGKDAEEAILNACLKINSAIKGTFLAGPNLSLADFVMFPFVDRLELAVSALKDTDPSKIEEFKPNDPRGKQWPVLLEYLLRMRELPFVARVRTTAQVKARVAATARSGHPEWDI